MLQKKIIKQLRRREYMGEDVILKGLPYEGASWGKYFRRYSSRKALSQ